MELIIGRDKEVAEIVAQLIPEYESSEDFGTSYTAIGFRSGDEFLAGAVYSNYRVHDIELSLAALSPKWSSRSSWRAVFAYPFQQLGTRRVTCIVNKKNKRVRRLMEGAGFKLEGVLREAFKSGADACVYGMLKSECRWIKNG